MALFNRSGLAAMLGGALLVAAALPAFAFPDIKAGQGKYDDPGISDDEITIGLFAALSGPNATIGTQAVKLAKAWYEMVNRQGGIWGRKVKLVVEDDRCNANDLVAAVKKLVEQDKVFLLHGSTCSAAVVGAQEYILRNKIPLITLQASADGLLYPPNDYVWGAFGMSIHAMGGTLIDFSVKHLKAKKIVYVKHDDDYGSWGLESGEFMMKEAGLKFAGVESISPAITDVTPVALKIRAAQPDAILLATYPQPATLLIKKLHEFGVKAPIVIGASALADVKRMVENVGNKEAFANSYLMDVINDVQKGPKQKWIHDLYNTIKDGNEAVASMPYGIGSSMTVTYGLMLSGPNPTRDIFRRVVKTMYFETGIMAGPVEFSDIDHAANENAIFLKFNGDTSTLVPGSYENRWTYTKK